MIKLTDDHHECLSDLDSIFKENNMEILYDMSWKTNGTSYHGIHMPWRDLFFTKSKNYKSFFDFYKKNKEVFDYLKKYNKREYKGLVRRLLDTLFNFSSFQSLNKSNIEDITELDNKMFNCFEMYPFWWIEYFEQRLSILNGEKNPKTIKIINKNI